MTLTCDYSDKLSLTEATVKKRKCPFVPLIVPRPFVFLAFEFCDVFENTAVPPGHERCFVKLFAFSQPFDLMRYDTFLCHVGVGVRQMFYSTPLLVV